MIKKAFKLFQRPKNIRFKKLLLKGVFCAMACDGEIHPDEVSELKEMVSESSYFDGLDYEYELEIATDEIHKEGAIYIEHFIDELRGFEMDSEQELQMVEEIVRMIEADHKVDESELYFLQKVKLTLKTERRILIAKFPEYAHLIKDEAYHGDHFKEGLEFIDTSALNLVRVNPFI